MFDLYKHKIKSVEEMREIIGPRPREKKVVMCHGTFDIVHPGHIRHLIYAKNQGDILIASLTCDEFVQKGEGHPYVPQELRATNLAALEVVDYVLVDRHPEPLENIAMLQPDLFVKGFEYTAAGIHPKTKQEMEVVYSYGGEFIFTPGDIVYSSTKLLAQHRPRLTLEKTTTLMQAEGLTFDHLKETIHQLPGISVHVIGDTIVDKYSYCNLLGPIKKTPTFSVKLEKSKLFVGGAGIVAKHLRSLGADVAFTTVLGKDELADFVVKDIEEAGITINAIIDPHRPTTLKERFWADNYKLLQVDTLDNSPLALKHLQEIQSKIENTIAELVVFSDFRHGLFYKDSVKMLTRAIPQDVIKVADSQVSNRWGNILDFKKFDLITPNEYEARFALADQDSVVRHMAGQLLKKAKAKYLILKLGERGLLTYHQATDKPRSFFFMDSFVEDLVDATGAGDALLAAASLSLVHSKNIILSAILGNLGAAIACETEGNVPVTPQMLLDKLENLEKQSEIQKV